MIMEIWLPKSIVYGIPEEKFWHMNPRRMEPYEKAQEMQDEKWKKRLEVEAWAHGMYVHRAIGCAFSKPSKPYPKEPDELFKPNESEQLSDADKFYAYMLKHNAARRAKSMG